MDPLSVGASVIAVFGATGKVIKGIHRLKALRDAPRELDDLIAEISQLEIILQAVRKACQSSGSELGSLLETAQNILVDFESHIEYRLTEAGSSNKVDRWQWTRDSKNVERLRRKLRDVTANLVALVNVSTNTSLDQVSQLTNQMLSEHRQLSDKILPAVALLFQRLEESPSNRAALTGSLGNVRQLTLEPASQVNHNSANFPDCTSLQMDQTASKLHLRNGLRIGKTQTLNICDTDCICKCHVRRQLNAPGILSKVLGHGYIQTAGPSMLGTQCDTDSCKARAAPRLSVQYFLPKWLVSRMILMLFTSQPGCSPELLLRVPRVVDRRSNDAFLAIRWGDAKDLKAAIRNGSCTPYDVDQNGDTLLTIATRSMIWEILLCLSSYGEFCNPSSVAPSAEDNIWRNLILDPRNPSGISLNWQVTLLTELFPLIEWELYVERQRFTKLHQIVCGLSGLSLEIELQHSTAINKLDRDCRSALWYALKHRRFDYGRILLEQGADPNIGDPPIWALAWGVYTDSATEVLLDFGPTRSYTFTLSDDLEGWPNFVSGVRIMNTDEMLVRLGSDVNHRSKWYGVEDVTILMSMARNDAAHHVKQLIKLGADIEVTDEEGKTALMYAACGSSHRAFDSLARAGARIDSKTFTGSTVGLCLGHSIHVLAFFHTCRLHVDCMS